VIQIIDCEQGSADWFAARAGQPTASEFSTVLAEGREGMLPSAIIDAMVKNGCTATQLAAAVKAARAKGASPSAGRLRYMRQLAGEILTGEPAPGGYTNDFMERGKELEDEARSLFAFMRDVEPERVGFIKNGRMGCSPDSLIGADSGLEIKVAIPAVQIERLQRGELPTEHVAQVQGSMLVTERGSWSFMSYCPGLPSLVLDVPRDDAYCARLAKAMEAFNTELDAMVQSIRTYSDFNSQARAA